MAWEEILYNLTPEARMVMELRKESSEARAAMLLSCAEGRMGSLLQEYEDAKQGMVREMKGWLAYLRPLMSSLGSTIEQFEDADSLSIEARELDEGERGYAPLNENRVTSLFRTNKNSKLSTDFLVAVLGVDGVHLNSEIIAVMPRKVAHKVLRKIYQRGWHLTDEFTQLMKEHRRNNIVDTDFPLNANILKTIEGGHDECQSRVPNWYDNTLRGLLMIYLDCVPSNFDKFRLGTHRNKIKKPFDIDGVTQMTG